MTMTTRYWSISRRRVVSTAGPAISGVPRGTTPTASAVDESLISIITSSNQILDGQNQQNNATSYQEIGYLNAQELENSLANDNEP
jgi:hypothetical protein